MRHRRRGDGAARCSATSGEDIGSGWLTQNADQDGGRHRRRPRAQPRWKARPGLVGFRHCGTAARPRPRLQAAMQAQEHCPHSIPAAFSPPPPPTTSPSPRLDCASPAQPQPPTSTCALHRRKTAEPQSCLGPVIAAQPHHVCRWGSIQGLRDDAGFKKGVNRATTQVLMKTGQVERTNDRDFETEQRYAPPPPPDSPFPSPPSRHPTMSHGTR